MNDKKFTEADMANFGQYCIRQFALFRNHDSNFAQRILPEFIGEAVEKTTVPMKKVFIFSICGTCDEPTGIIEPCTELGWNDFPATNFHGELSIEETEKLRTRLIESLKREGMLDKAEYIENNTRVMEVTFTEPITQNHVQDIA